jgi:hypothetical protein
VEKRKSKPLKAKLIADFDNLASVGEGFDDVDEVSENTNVVPYDPFEKYEELIKLEKQKQKVVKKLRTPDRKRNESEFREDLDADKHKALRALREALENPNTDTKEKIAAAKAILSQVDKQRELDLKERADDKEDVREKAKILLASQINTDEMTRALAGMAPLLTSAQRDLKEEG